ncbi:putative fasciclin-like arabinogalactan protein 20 [Bienertia sinuspersici]
MASFNSTFSLLTLLLTISLLLKLACTISDKTIENSAEILSNSNFNSMSLTLPLIAKTLISFFPSATLFAPSDASFSLSSAIAGQPSLSLLQFHFCPRYYSFSDLQSLSYGSKLDTLLPNHPLTITSSVFDDDVSINGVKIKNSPVFDDGFLVVYEIEKFFNPNYTLGGSELSPSPNSGSRECRTPGYDDGLYGEASEVLRSRGYSLMGSFLDLQFSQFYENNDDEEKVITVFAFPDSAMEGQSGNFSEWGSIFLGHVVGCELSWGDLVGLDDGFVLPTFLKGFMINVAHSNHKDSAYSLILNGNVYVEFPEFYRNDKIVVHGLSGILAVPEKSNQYRKGAYSPVNHVEF